MSDTIIVEFTEESARAILDEILMLKGATAVEWKTQTPKLTALENTFVAMLNQGRAA